MDEIWAKFIDRLGEKLEEFFKARIFPRFDKYFRSGVQLTFTEEEAARQLGIEKSTLAQIRRDKKINHYGYGKSATYGLHHLQDYASRHEVKNVPSSFSLKSEISLFGSETEVKLRKVS